jgi:hypothetical protein
MRQNEEYKVDYNSQNIPASVKELKPKIYKEETNWCVRSSEDIAGGILGRGATPEEAMEDFDANYAKTKENSV